jgi:glycosyl transferase family 25
MMKIFVISLSDQKKRQDYIRSLFDTKGIPFEFLFGVDGRKLSQEEIDTFYDSKKARKYDGELSRGEIGCSLSHKLVYERMIKNKIERALVLEDDVNLKDDFFLILDFLEKIPVNNYVIKLDKFNSGQIGYNNGSRALFAPWHQIPLNKEYSIKQPLHDPTLAWGYYIDIKAAHTLFNLHSKVFIVADAWYYYKRFIRLRMINNAVIDSNLQYESIIKTHISSQNKSKIIKKNSTIYKIQRHIINKIKKYLNWNKEYSLK